MMSVKEVFQVSFGEAMEGYHIPVSLHQLAKECAPDTRERVSIGTIYFPEGTPASEVCRYIMNKKITKSGIWLLQMKVTNPDYYQDVEDGCYVMIKDSKHRLEQQHQYTAMYYNGPNMFLLST